MFSLTSMKKDYLLTRHMPCHELSDQLGAENLLGLVKITFLPKVPFVLSSYCGQSIANQMSGRPDMLRLFVSAVHLF
jgi:hypothetical protein